MARWAREMLAIYATGLPAAPEGGPPWRAGRPSQRYVE